MSRLNASRIDNLPPNAQSEVVAEAVCNDIENQFAAGTAPRAEEYFQRFPAVAADDSLCLMVINAEWLARLRYGPPPTWKEFADRFPHLADRLPGRPPPPAATPKEAGRYRLGKLLGSGGMAEVYEAFDPDFDRPLAAKVMVMRPRASERRFDAEADMTARLQHPGIPPVFARGYTADHRPYFVMKRIVGQDLAKELAARESPAADRPRFVQVFEQICQTVGYAHGERIIHRDLKPHNVMVGAFGEVQVMDWGLAKDLAAPAKPATEADADTRPDAVPGLPDATTDQTGAWTRGDGTDGPMGTFAYMAPEQAGAKWDVVDARADVFGLGAILCHILTGQPPYTQSESWAVIDLAQAANLDGAFDRLGRCGADAELVALCRRCLSPDPADRPDDGAAVAAAVAAYQKAVADKLQQARIDEARAKLQVAEQKARRRVWRIVAAVSAAGVVLASGLAGRAVQQRWRAETNAALTLHEKARSSMQRGRWADALETIDRLLADGRLDPAELRLERARLLLDLNRTDDCRAAIDAETSRSAPWLVLEADLELGRDNALGRGLLDEANRRADELSREDREYVRGLLATNPRDARAAFRRVLADAPHHLRANVSLCYIELIQGDKRVAREMILAARGLYPDDANLGMLDALSLAKDGRHDDAARVFGTVRGQLQASDRAAIEFVLGIIKVALDFEDVFALTDAELMARLAKVGLLWAPAGDNVELRVPGSRVVLGVPPLIRDRLNSMFPNIDFRQPQAAAKEVLERIRDQKQPLAFADGTIDGVIPLMSGMSLMSDGKFGQARKHLNDAMNTPSLFKLERLATTLLALCEYKLAVSAPHLRSDPSRKPEVLRHLRSVFEMGGVPKYMPDQCILAAWQCGDPCLARTLAADLRRKKPSDPFIDALYASALWREGNPAESIRVTVEARQRKGLPADMQALLTKIENDARRAMAEAARANGLLPREMPPPPRPAK